MNCHIIADAGSTKTLWILKTSEGQEVRRVQTQGLNAIMCTLCDIQDAIEKVCAALAPEDTVSQVSFYGAGCSTPELCGKMQKALAEGFGAEKVEVASDLLGAARGLLGDRAGIACILGTGSNSCLYDGRNIVAHVPSLGYVLGDEGSGSAIGKRLLGDAFKGIMPRRLAEEFLGEFGLDVATAIEKTYRQPNANRFLASLASFVSGRHDDDYIHRLLLDEFGRFLDRNVKMYENACEIPLSFTGGIAYHNSAILREACERHGLQIDKITKQPF